MIIDCFTFNKEVDLLEKRIKYLWDTVDYFVIVEADVMFNGTPREFCYAKHIARFRQYERKILYFPYSIDVSGLDFVERPQSTWVVENAQRNWIGHALSLFNNHDNIIVSDVDEIPNKVAVKEAINYISNITPKIACEQILFCHDFRSRQLDPWCGSVVSTVKHVRETSAQHLRDMRFNTIRVANGGWHLCNWEMSAEEVSDKLKQYSHQEYNTPHYTDVDRLKKVIEEGGDYLGRGNVYVPFDFNTLPDDFKRLFVHAL